MGYGIAVQMCVHLILSNFKLIEESTCSIIGGFRKTMGPFLDVFFWALIPTFIMFLATVMLSCKENAGERSSYMVTSEKIFQFKN